ncbi:hypothetical protein BSKO_13437 [Bryopsis sp. KO-2023]|nr:hypothetical protein BSKO_13437 [Bryopsis sp. KO-2023]
MTTGLEWKIPSPYRRTVCVNNLKLETIGGGEDNTTRKYVYPILNVGGGTLRDGEVEEIGGQDPVNPERQGWSWKGVFNIMYSTLWKWVWRMPLKSSKCPSLCGRALMDWHPRFSILAAVATGQILIYSEKSLREGQQPHEVVRPKSQCKYYCVSYRPNSPGDIAAGSNDGLHLYTKSLPQLTEGSLLAHESCSYHMKKLGQGQVDCIAWHPSGNIVATAGSSMSGFTVWDVNLGTGVRMAVLLERVNLLRWSPCGSYIASASQDGKFYLWEVRNWSMKSWDCGKWGFVVSAEWDPRSRYIVLAFAKVHKLITVHITQDPPALDTSWIGLDMDQLSPTTDNILDGVSKNPGCIDWMTWNHDGSRMAVALKNPHPAAECIAIFDTTMSGGLNAIFIGYARPFQRPVTGEYSVGPTFMKFHKRSGEGKEDILAVRQGRSISFLEIVRKRK